MSLFLLLLGAVTTAVGLALVVSGVPIHDGTFDTELVTPGTIAAVGGLLLVAMGLAVRELRRIERALVARPMPRLARPGEAAVAPAESAHIPFPPKPKVKPQLAPLAPAAATAPAGAEDAPLERGRVKFPSLVRLESSADVEVGDAPVRAASDVGEVKVGEVKVGEVKVGEVKVGEVKNMTPSSHVPTGAAPARAAPRSDTKSRASAISPKTPKRSVLNAFWPGRPRREAQTAAAQPVTEPVSVAQAVSEPSAAAGESATTAAASAAPASVAPASLAPVSVLKSGVVEGMAYTLYSDGSIEAQLPQGTLRFGSITALRDHIENAS